MENSQARVNKGHLGEVQTCVEFRHGEVRLMIGAHGGIRLCSQNTERAGIGGLLGKG